MSERYDAVVIGMGPAGEVAATRLIEQGLRVAVVERELIGGECGYWACIPTKTLLRPPEARAEARRVAGLAEPEQRWAEIAAYRDGMIRHLDDGAQVEGYERQGATVRKGPARIVGPGEVEVGGESLATERIVVATGSDPRIPPIDGLADAGYWTNREATTMAQVPASAIVLGGGPVGVELAQLLRRTGADVVLVQSADRLLDREEPDATRRIHDALVEEGIEVRLGAQAQRVRRGSDGRRVVGLDDGGEVAGEQLIVATGRAPRTAGLGLESVGIELDARGGIPVDERCRAAEGVWAIGDVTGVMPFTHVGMYQGRIAAADIAGRAARADYTGVPRVVFTDPEIAAVGLTAAQADERGLDVASAAIELPELIARPWTYEREPQGGLGVLADRRRGVLVGAWAVAPLASEWIHYAALAIRAEIPVDVLTDGVAQFPTFTEAYLKALERLDL